MSDRDEHDQTLTPEQEAQLRRLLAEARHTDPMPADVVARLDRVLDGLADEPARAAKVVRLADRRRTATRLLVAAAAVVVLGVGGSQVVDGLGSAGMDAMTGSEEEPAADEDLVEGGNAPEATNGEGAPRDNDLQRFVAKVRPDSFADDATALRDLVPSSDSAYQQSGSAVDEELAGDVCPTGAWGTGRYVAVRYAGDPGWIVFRRPQGDTQVADLFLCGSELARRSLTLPYP
jgi:hypothetical protein